MPGEVFISYAREDTDFVRRLHDALAAIGRRDDAVTMFEEMLQCRNHLGLLSEDTDPLTGELWGNFPQTYSMVGLIHSARVLSTPWEEAF